METISTQSTSEATTKHKLDVWNEIVSYLEQLYKHQQRILRRFPEYRMFQSFLHDCTMIGVRTSSNNEHQWRQHEAKTSITVMPELNKVIRTSEKDDSIVVELLDAMTQELRQLRGALHEAGDVNGTAGTVTLEGKLTALRSQAVNMVLMMTEAQRWW